MIIPKETFKERFFIKALGSIHSLWTNGLTPILNCLGGGDVPKFEPKKWLKFKDIDNSIQELRHIFKIHPEWFETPHPESNRGKNEVDYSI
jgi:hypothetical protein